MSWALWTIGPGVNTVSGELKLGGDRGFTLKGFAEFGNVGPSNACFGLATPSCSPGTTISLSALSAGLEVTATGTLDGLSIPQIGGICAGSRPPAPPCGTPGFEFTGQAVVPQFGDFTKAIVTVPAGFSGFLNLDTGDPQNAPNTLVASAIATLTLDKVNSTNPQFPGPAWRYAGIEYELEPIPEPTTLLLFGTAMAGLGLARWRQRQQAKRP